MSVEEEIAKTTTEIKDLENQLLSKRIERRGIVVAQILLLPPIERLKILQKFCSRCGEVDCPDRYSCQPKSED